LAQHITRQRTTLGLESVLVHSIAIHRKGHSDTIHLDAPILSIPTLSSEPDIYLWISPKIAHLGLGFLALIVNGPVHLVYPRVLQHSTYESGEYTRNESEVWGKERAGLRVWVRVGVGVG
jgi:hypothetical protein